MKVLFDHSSPFLLAHGGFQIQIEQTKSALESLGTDVEFVRWWDERQTGDLIHYFGRPPASYLALARQKGVAVVFTELLGGLSSRPPLLRFLQRGLIRAAQMALPSQFTARLAWDAYREAAACIALTPWEKRLMEQMFSAPPQKVRVIPNGVEGIFLQHKPASRDKWLVCTATICNVKRVLELAEAAVAAQVPVWFIGKPYSKADPYANRFMSFADEHPELVRYQGPIDSRAALADAYRTARGFVLVSQWESLSLAALEAAACECPLLLSDRPWARSVFGSQAMYCPVRSPRIMADSLKDFYQRAPNLKPPSKPESWADVAAKLRELYTEITLARL